MIDWAALKFESADTSSLKNDWSESRHLRTIVRLNRLSPSFDRLLFITPIWRNLFENALTVQFDHRMLADGIWFLAILHAFDAWRRQYAARGAIVLAGAVTLQAALGIVALLYKVPLALSLAHQVMALVVFTIAVIHAERLSHRAIARLPQAAG